MELKVPASLAVKLTMLVMVGSSLIFALVLTYSYMTSRDIILADAEDRARSLALSTARNMQLELRAVEEITKRSALFLDHTRMDDSTLREVIRKTVVEEEAIFGSVVAFEPFAFDPELRWYAPYFFKEGKNIGYADLASDSYNYSSKDWYRKPKELEAPEWSPPYFDEGGGNVIMTTYSAPFFTNAEGNSARKVAGVVTADLSVEWLTKQLSEVKVGLTGYCFLISQSGVFLAHPEKDLIMRESIFTVADRAGKAHLREVGRLMLSQDVGFLDVGKSIRGRESFLGFARLPNNGWSLGVVFPKDELFSDVTGLYQTNTLMAIAGVGLLLAMSLLIARSIASPLRRMANVAGRVAAGDLDLDLPEVKRTDEVGSLAKAFSQMAVDLKKYIRELTETTAAKQKIESELSIAAEIQRSLLPDDSPTRPGYENHEVFALMEPARHVGGDFYDFFPVGEGLFYFVIADVCGKGIPAALLMAGTKSILENMAAEGIEANRLLDRVNQRLATRNDQCVFVTLFLGILDVNTGELTYGNAGHDPPLLIREDGGVGFLEGPRCPALGLFLDERFPTGTITLKPGDLLFMYTDGVTEAMDKEEALFSKERLLNELERLRGQTVRSVVNGVFREVKVFAQGAVQSDDITILALRFNKHHGGLPSEKEGNGHGVDGTEK